MSQSTDKTGYPQYPAKYDSAAIQRCPTHAAGNIRDTGNTIQFQPLQNRAFTPFTFTPVWFKLMIMLIILFDFNTYKNLVSNKKRGVTLWKPRMLIEKKPTPG
jgi:hypothetical protein